MIGNDGFYIILKGLARAEKKVYKNLIKENASTTSFIPQSFHRSVFSEDLKNTLVPEMEVPSCDSVVRNNCFSHVYHCKILSLPDI